MGRLGRVKDGTSEGLMDFMALDGCRVTLRYVPGLRRLSPPMREESVRNTNVIAWFRRPLAVAAGMWLIALFRLADSRALAESAPALL